MNRKHPTLLPSPRYLLSLLLLLAPPLLSAQVSIGAGGGFTGGIATIDLHPPDTCNCIHQYDGTTDNLQAFVEFAFPVTDAGTIEAVLRVAWTGAQAEFIHRYGLVRISTPAAETESDIAEQRMSFSTTALQLQPLVRIRLGPAFLLSAGPVIGYRSARDYQYTQQIVSPVTCTDCLEQWERTGGVLGTYVRGLASNSLALGAIVGAQYQFRLNSHLSIVPEIQIQGDFSSPYQGVGWVGVQAGGALSVRYDR